MFSVLTFDRYDIRGLVNGKSIIGKSFHDFRDEVAVKGLYHFQELEDINGVFKAHIQDGAVFIQYYGTEAIFIGKTESHLKVDQFAGATKVLETESFRCVFYGIQL